MVAGIDRNSVLPLYYQLKQRILAEIEERGVAPGDRLPGDNELCRRYEVSRTVVRQALSELEHEGVIDRVKGIGTFLAAPKVSEGLVQAPLSGLYDDVAARGGTLVSEVRRQEVVPASAQIAEQLECAVDDELIMIERLRFVDGEPWVMTITHLPYDIAPGLVHEDLREQSLYGLLERKYGVELVSARRSVEAGSASVELARDLGIGEDRPVLVLRNVTFGSQGRPVESFVAYHRGDRSRFEVMLARRAAANAAPSMVVKD